MANGIARDLAIKLLASLVSQMISEEQYREVVRGHLLAIQRLEADSDPDSEMNEKIAAHFHELLVPLDDDVH